MIGGNISVAVDILETRTKATPVLPPTRSVDGDGRGEGYFCVVVAGLGIGCEEEGEERGKGKCRRGG
ncbi:unnamed protein product [Linum tenue]|uniref:Uncharacterized protein n=1 Tax=Linum tenue TaxID=586396 RepID=A0AAV0R0F7_9ROSI|nr:unnamed protein product [Linum tenue]